MNSDCEGSWYQWTYLIYSNIVWLPFMIDKRNPLHYSLGSFGESWWSTSNDCATAMPKERVQGLPRQTCHRLGDYWLQRLWQLWNQGLCRHVWIVMIVMIIIVIMIVMIIVISSSINMLYGMINQAPCQTHTIQVVWERRHIRASGYNRSHPVKVGIRWDQYWSFTCWIPAAILQAIRCCPNRTCSWQRWQPTRTGRIEASSMFASNEWAGQLPLGLKTSLGTWGWLILSNGIAT